VAEYEFPPGLNGILSTCAITLVPEYDAVIARGKAALAPGGRLAVFDLKEPGGWPEWAIRAYVAISRPLSAGGNEAREELGPAHRLDQWM
jgi:demethylmenaquinone methyltransferase/2-methoxy-6-polyprenyl-1,4-benzoquinol methylase